MAHDFKIKLFLHCSMAMNWFKSDYESEHEISLCRKRNKRGIGCFQSNFN